MGATGFSAEPGMVFVPGGEFARGRTYQWSDYDVKWYPTAHQDDRPVKTIRVDPIYLDQSEVTNEQYAAFVKATGHRAPYHWIKGQFPADKAKHPVVNVSWDDATAYCTWQKKRLPTEAEWERACRGIEEGAMFPWGNRGITPKDAHYSSQVSSPVCAKEKNYFGLCDIIGNVWEWTSDWYMRTYYQESPTDNPKGPPKGMYRVLRGGSWFDEPPLFLTCSYRSWARPVERSPTVGFRCAKSFPTPPNRASR
jgi:formylglycine-generating enzyme required for sulfatase activity